MTTQTEMIAITLDFFRNRRETPTKMTNMSQIHTGEARVKEVIRYSGIPGGYVSR
jgi:hypothetical protein